MRRSSKYSFLGVGSQDGLLLRRLYHPLSCLLSDAVTRHYILKFVYAYDNLTNSAFRNHGSNGLGFCVAFVLQRCVL